MSGGLIGKQTAPRSLTGTDIAPATISGSNMAAGTLEGVTTVTSGTTAITAAMEGVILADATSGNVILNLPAANAQLSPVLFYRFIRIDTSANSVTVNRAGSDTIDGATSFVIPPAGYVSLTSNNSNGWRTSNRPGNRGMVLMNTANTMTIATAVVTQFNPSGGWTTIYDTTPTSISGNTIVVPSNWGITRAVINAAIPMNSSPANGIAISIRKNSTVIAGTAGAASGSSFGGGVATQTLCTGGDVFDLAFITTTGSGTLNNSTTLYGNAYFAVTWI